MHIDGTNLGMDSEAAKETSINLCFAAAIELVQGMLKSSSSEDGHHVQ